MNDRQRFVIDTNTLLSAVLLPASTPDRAVRRAVEGGQLLMSLATLDELVDVLARPKFDPYVPIEDRQAYVRTLAPLVELVEIMQRVQACRDPRDDKFLEVAVNGRAQAIITGDRDLLDLHPFRGIPILTPASYLAGAR